MSGLIWHDATPRSGWQQMAIDRALADIASREQVVVRRLYRWEADTISFGANEAAIRTWARNAIERAKLPVVRRPTGGRGVWHDAGDLTYSVAGPARVLGGLRTAYDVIHRQLAGALRRIASDVEVAPPLRRPTLSPGACFELAVGGEVLVGGRKTIGSAQALIGDTILQHGAIALADRSEALARFRLESPLFSLECPPAIALAPDDVTEVIMAAWIDDGGAAAPRSFTERVIAASELHRPHFEDPSWSWRR